MIGSDRRVCVGVTCRGEIPWGCDVSDRSRWKGSGARLHRPGPLPSVPSGSVTSDPPPIVRSAGGPQGEELIEAVDLAEIIAAALQDRGRDQVDGYVAARAQAARATSAGLAAAGGRRPGGRRRRAEGAWDVVPGLSSAPSGAGERR